MAWWVKWIRHGLSSHFVHDSVPPPPPADPILLKITRLHYLNIALLQCSFMQSTLEFYQYIICIWNSIVTAVILENNTWNASPTFLFHVACRDFAKCTFPFFSHTLHYRRGLSSWQSQIKLEQRCEVSCRPSVTAFENVWLAFDLRFFTSDHFASNKWAVCSFASNKWVNCNTCDLKTCG